MTAKPDSDKQYRAIGLVTNVPLYDSEGILHFSVIVQSALYPDYDTSLINKKLQMIFEGNNTLPNIRKGEKIGVYVGQWVVDLDNELRSVGEIETPRFEILDETGGVVAEYQQKNPSLRPLRIPQPPREM